jgi:enoyl-[acyl-carrier-protein] reductase (NADH)
VPSAVQEAILERQACPAPVTADDVAVAATYLATASGVTGHTLVVDQGLLA